MIKIERSSKRWEECNNCHEENVHTISVMPNTGSDGIQIRLCRSCLMEFMGAAKLMLDNPTLSSITTAGKVD